ncbi:MAG TPA: hypothetical protein PLS50_03220 [Candidatus Dojkabacteria bacterium]|nr:hypothetical protein [Candidatus Dojkabacteria bacterium]
MSEDKTALEEKYIQQIPWDKVFKDFSKHVRDHFISMIELYDEEQAKYWKNDMNNKDAIMKELQRRAQPLVDLEKKDSEGTRNE